MQVRKEMAWVHVVQDYAGSISPAPPSMGLREIAK